MIQQQTPILAAVRPRIKILATALLPVEIAVFGGRLPNITDIINILHTPETFSTILWITTGRLETLHNIFFFF